VSDGRKRANYAENEQYKLRHRDFDKFDGQEEPAVEDPIPHPNKDIVTDAAELREENPLPEDPPSDEYQQRKDKNAYGYFKQDDFANWSEENVDLDSYGVDMFVEEGEESDYWSDEADEQPHIKEDQETHNLPTG
jgi:hypothetical protein